VGDLVEAAKVERMPLQIKHVPANLQPHTSYLGKLLKQKRK